MFKNSPVFPVLPVATTGQSLISHAGLNVVTAFIDALGFRALCEERLGQFVPAGARHRPGGILGSLWVQFSVSYPVPVMKTRMVAWFNEKKYWQPALNQSGEERSDAWVVNATDTLGLTDYPERPNLYPRADPLHPGAQATLLDQDGHREAAFLTNSPRWHGPPRCQASGTGRCENRIKTLKNMGLGKLKTLDCDDVRLSSLISRVFRRRRACT